MSTSGFLREHKRSWSEENLFQIQTKEEIASLKKQLKESQRLGEEQSTKIKTSQSELQSLRVRLYDESKARAKAEKILSQKKKRNPKRSNRKKSVTDSPRVQNKAEARRKKAAAKFDAEEEIALQFLQKELEGNNDMHDMLGIRSAAPTVSTTPPQVEGDVVPTSVVAVEHEFGDGPLEYEFDMNALAEAVPTITLKTAIDAQEKFVAADLNKNMLLDSDELMHVLPQQLIDALGVDSKLITQTGLKIGVDVHENEYDFLACVKIILEFQTQWESERASSVTPIPSRVNKNSALPSIGQNTQPKQRFRARKSTTRISTSDDKNDQISTACAIM
eukprot:m.50466 g.50466  ORF g.50466 m.50466 type:complete len:333 (-) comp21300_c0_seq3:241-1239(-)